MSFVANKVFQATAKAPLAASLTPPDYNIYLVCVKLHLSAVGGVAEDFTVTINSATATAYDTLIFSQDMLTVQDILWLPDQPIPVVNGDVIDFAYANTGNVTYALEVIYRREH